MSYDCNVECMLLGNVVRELCCVRKGQLTTELSDCEILSIIDKLVRDLFAYTGRRPRSKVCITICVRMMKRCICTIVQHSFGAYKQLCDHSIMNPLCIVNA